jgi:ubiquinone biosynthesis monooxygenase Coq7
MSRQYSLTDRLLGEVQNALLTVFAEPTPTERENPAKSVGDIELSSSEQRQSTGFMRVNHTGEVCAQALYRGQAWCAKDSAVSNFLTLAVVEEQDHLVWCHQRLQELDSRRSILNVYWYTHSFILGWFAGKVGDGWSLGFVEETEVQVGRHLQAHMEKLSNKDQKSLAIIQQMDVDEAEHAAKAKELGAKELPGWIKQVMRVHSKVMTTLAYWV